MRARLRILICSVFRRKQSRCIIILILLSFSIYIVTFIPSLLPNLYIEYCPNETVKALYDLDTSDWSVSNKEFGRSSRSETDRSINDGSWIVVEPLELYLYSAFYDDRTSLREPPRLRVIGVLERPYYRTLYCHVAYSNVNHVYIRAAELEPIGVGLDVERHHLQEFVFTCKLPPTANCIPARVTISKYRHLGDYKWLPATVPYRPPHTNGQGFLAICLSVSYGAVNTQRMVEWLEIQKILGVDRVFMYNHSMTDGEHLLSVLSSYITEGFLQLRQSHDFLGTVEPSRAAFNDALLHMSPTINDCMYRNMNAFRYFMIIDLDEVIVPRVDGGDITPHKGGDGRSLLTIPSMIGELPDVLNVRGKRVAAYVFRNAYFFLDLAHDLNPSLAASLYLTHRRRLKPSDPAYSVKSIVDSQACVAMHNHYCWSFTREAASSWTEASVTPSVALLHHYKYCHVDHWEQRNGQCATLMKGAVFDDTLLTYQQTLLTSLHAKIKLFNMSVT